MVAPRAHILAVALAVLAACGQETESADQALTEVCHPPGDEPGRELRAMWIASVWNLDWPSAQGLPAAQQQAEYRALLDLAVRTGLNAVFVHVRPTADAYYDSPYEPWSHWLSGTQGVGPGYDVLEFLVAEAHARNLEFHAWFNPYRVGHQADPSFLAADHPVKQHPDWLVTYGDRLYFDPGLPEVREHIEAVILDVVERYDVDAVVFDDYFYPYPIAGQVFDDEATFAAHGAGFASKADWRRDNVNRLIAEVGQKVRDARPNLRFGVSPFGIWKNQSSDPTGSPTSGLEAFTAIHADSRAWIQGGFVDYIAPQLYWAIGQPAARYEALVPWWVEEVAGTDVQLFIAQASYKVGGNLWTDPAELVNHIAIDRASEAVRGEVFFSARDVKQDKLGVTTALATGPLARPALIPVPTSPPLVGSPPAPAALLFAWHGEDGAELAWLDGGGWSGAATYYAVYRVDGPALFDGCGVATPANLIGTVRADGLAQRFVDRAAEPGKVYTYAVTAVDRVHRESAPRWTVALP